MIWITADDVIALHSRVIQTSGGIDGLCDRAGLEAAIAAPLQAFGGQDLFPSMLEKSHDLATASLLITLSLTATSASAP